MTSTKITNKTLARKLANDAAKEAAAQIGHNNPPDLTPAERAAAWAAALKGLDTSLSAAVTLANAAIDSASESVILLAAELAKGEDFASLSEQRYNDDVAPLIAKAVDALHIGKSAKASYRSFAKGLFLCAAHKVVLPDGLPAGLSRQSAARSKALRDAGVLQALPDGEKRGPKASNANADKTPVKGVTGNASPAADTPVSPAADTPVSPAADTPVSPAADTPVYAAPPRRVTFDRGVVLTRADLCAAVYMLTGLPEDGERAGRYADLFADVSKRRQILAYLDTFDVPAPKAKRDAPKAKAPKGAMLTVDTAKLTDPVDF